MKITIVRTGGLAGMRAQLGPVETGQLGEAGVRIANEVEKAGFFELPSELPVRTRIDDGFNYAMTIEDGERRHSVSYGDGTELSARRPVAEIQRMLVASGVDFEWGVRAEAAVETLGHGEDFSWTAWRNRMPGINDPDLHVVGSCEFSTSSVELSLKPGNEGIWDDPALIVLDLTISKPQLGDDQMSLEYAIWTGDVGPDVKQVRIQGDATAEFDVIDAT
jgi:Emfourin